MTDVKTLPINEKILFHAHMLAQLCDQIRCDDCPLMDRNATQCLASDLHDDYFTAEIERRYQDARNKREKK